MWAHKDTKQANMLNTQQDLNNFYHPKSPSFLPSLMAFCGNGNMILVCEVTLPCDQREVWVDVGYWTILCVSDG